MGVLQVRLCQCPISVSLVGVLVQVLLFALLSMATASAEDDVTLTREEEAALKTITDGTNQFAINLYKELIKTESGNVFVSPLSAQMVLALAYTGAEGATASELKSLLSLPESLNQTYSGYHSLIKSLQDPVLKLANRMFVEKTAEVKKNFQNNAQKYFLAPAELVGFQENPDKSREHINLWVENQTNKKIQNIIPPGVIDMYTRLVLVNAIHFKANWKLKFDAQNTKEEPFHVSKTETKPVQMMHIKKKFGFSKSEALKSKILELEYEGLNFRMIIILPDEIDGLAEVEAKLDTVNIFDELNYLRQPTVTVALPKFKLEKTMNLNTILKSMGVKTMFGDTADFSKLSDEQLVVSQVIQKAFVEVNEEGTEAAAATVGVIRLRRSLEMEEEPEEFIADHPFAFIISQTSSRSVVFAGRLCNPDLAESQSDRSHDEL